MVQFNDVPVVDLHAKEGSPVTDLGNDTAHAICEALKKCGAVYLVNHGIPKDLINNAYDVSNYFFNLPEKEKRECKVFSPEALEGYSHFGAEKLGPEEECKEAYDILLADGTYPTNPSGFKPVMEELTERLVELNLHTLRLMAKGLGLPNETFTGYHVNMMKKGELSTLRIAYYPPIKSCIENTIRCGCHTDYGSSTLLIPEKQGLMIRIDPLREWTEVTPKPGAILVIVGDLMEIWTGGELKATEHMVPVPEDLFLRSQSRCSIILFSAPDKGTTIHPLFGDKTKYKPVDTIEHYVGKIEDTY